MTGHKKIIFRRTAIIVFFAAVPAALFILPDVFSFTAKLLPPCSFYLTTGYLCPGCGMTRSVLSLVRLRILDSLLYNPVAVLLSLIILLHVAEHIADAFFSKRIKLLPRKNAFWVTLIIVMFLYLVIRNFLPVVSLR